MSEDERIIHALMGEAETQRRRAENAEEVLEASRLSRRSLQRELDESLAKEAATAKAFRDLRDDKFGEDFRLFGLSLDEIRSQQVELETIRRILRQFAAALANEPMKLGLPLPDFRGAKHIAPDPPYPQVVISAGSWQPVEGLTWDPTKVAFELDILHLCSNGLLSTLTLPC